jgi:hypothetical protein
MDVPGDYDEADENPMDAAGYDESLMQDGDDLIEDTDIFNSNEMELDDEKKSESKLFSSIIP